MAQHGSLINHLSARSNATEPPENIKPGDGLTELMWSDRNAFTVVEVSATRQTVKVQRDKAIRTDKNGMSDSQSYRYEPQPDAPIITLRWSKKKGRYTHKGTPFAPGRNSYHDYSF